MKKVGRPRKIESPEDMQKAVDEYFSVCEERRKENPLSAPPTVSGMCYFLGFEDRHALQEYAKRPEFSATVKRAKLRLENILEEHLFGNSVTGVIFNLKNNYGWKDKHEQEISGPDGGAIPTRIELVPASDNPKD